MKTRVKNIGTIINTTRRNQDALNNLYSRPSTIFENTINLERSCKPLAFIVPWQMEKIHLAPGNIL